LFLMEIVMCPVFLIAFHIVRFQFGQGPMTAKKKKKEKKMKKKIETLDLLFR